MASHSPFRSTDDVTHWCGNVFEAFALTVDDVVECHDALPDEGVETVAGLVRAARGRPSTFPDPVTFARETLVASVRGVDAPGQYWATAPEVHLDALFAPFDCRVTVEWRRADTRRIALEDADGRKFRATLTYPESPLGQDNYPALLDAVNRDLLSGTGVELVLLDGPCERWQYALGETAALNKLRRRYGETVQFGNRGLLAEYQPPEYVPENGDDVPMPEWASSPRDDLVDERALAAAEATFAELAERIDRSAGAFADVDPEAVAAGADGPVRETAPAGDVAALFDDLSDVWPLGGDGDRARDGKRRRAPTADRSPAANQSTADDRAVDAATPVLGSSARESTDEPEAIDELFRRLERDVAAQSRDDVDDAADRTRPSDPDATPDDVVEAPARRDGGTRIVGGDGSADRSGFVWLDDRQLESRPGRP